MTFQEYKAKRYAVGVPMTGLANLINSDTCPSDLAVVSATMADLRRLADKHYPTPDGMWPGSREKEVVDHLSLTVGAALLEGSLKLVGHVPSDMRAGDAVDLLKALVTAVGEANRLHPDYNRLIEADQMLKAAAEFLGETLCYAADAADQEVA